MKLTDKENKLFKMASTGSGVVFIQGRAGEGKSAIVKSIADKMGFAFFDIRIAQCDETDLGLFPVVVEDGGNKALCHAIPEWAAAANAAPNGAIVFFDELNRASLNVRNAALQILLDKKIGWKFKFNPNVFFFAAGNIGAEDGCDVEEFDAALWNRLIHVNHKLDVNEWVEGFAKKNVWSIIVDYLMTHPSEFYMRAPDSSVYATPRSWTFLSDYLKSFFGNDLSKISISEAARIVKDDGKAYVGASYVKFAQYLDDINAISIKDVINDYPKHEAQLMKMNKARLNDLTKALESEPLAKLNGKQQKNVVSFLKLLHEDEVCGFLIQLLEKSDMVETPWLTQAFRPSLQVILKNIKS